MMKVTEAELQDLYRRQIGESDRGSCLGAEEIAALARDELGEEERRRAVAHLADCSDCSLELRMARSLEPWARNLAEQLEPDTAQTGDVVDLTMERSRREASKRPSGPRWLPAAIAAVLALMAVSAYLLLPSAPAPGPPGDVTRGDSVTDLHPADDSELERAPERFSWPTQLGATSYRVRLFDARAELLWESEPLRATEATLPPEILHRFESPGSYSWTVAVEGSAPRSRLGPFSFRVGPE